MTIYVEINTLRDSFNRRRSEWGLATILAFGWGWLPISTPGNSFDSPALAWLNMTLGEEAMALTAVIIGSIRLAVLIVNGSWRRCADARMVMAGFSMFVWMSILIGILKTGLASPGLVTYAVFFVMDGHTIYEAGREARRQDDRRNGIGA